MTKAQNKCKINAQLILTSLCACPRTWWSWTGTLPNYLYLQLLVHTEQPPAHADQFVGPYDLLAI
jgi:hypothetical protein